MNILEKILNAKEQIRAKDTSEIEIPRLSKMLNDKFIITISELTIDELDENEKKGNSVYSDVEIFNIIKACKVYDQKFGSFKEALGVHTPVDVVKTLFKPGETRKINNEILKLSGYNVDSIVSALPSEVIKDEIEKK